MAIDLTKKQPNPFVKQSAPTQQSTALPQSRMTPAPSQPTPSVSKPSGGSSSRKSVKEILTTPAPNPFTNKTETPVQPNETSPQLQSTKLGILDKSTGTYYNPDTGTPVRTEAAYVSNENIFGRTQEKIELKTKSGLDRGPIAGVTAPVLSTASFGLNLVTHPIATTKSTALGVGTLAAGTGLFLLGKGETPFAGVGQTIREEPGYSLGFLAGSYGVIKAMPKVTNVLAKPFQAINIRVNPNAVPFEETGVKVVEGMTIPTPLRTLKGYEGGTIDTVHTTLSPELKSGSFLSPPEDLSKVSGWRKAIGQFNFFQSTPSEGQPVVYGGYAGIGEGSSAGSDIKLVLVKPNVKAFIFRGQKISETPSSILKGGVKSTIEYQTNIPGTYIPGENLFEMSKEGQVISSVSSKGSPVFQLEENPSGPLGGKFTYYNQKVNAPEFINARPTLKNIWNTFTSKNVKINFEEVKLKQIRTSGNFVQPKGTIDLGKYSSSYGSSKYVSSGDILKSISPIVLSTNKDSSSIKSSTSIPSTFSSPFISPKSNSKSFGSASISRPKLSSSVSNISSSISPPTIVSSFVISSKSISSPSFNSSGYYYVSPFPVKSFWSPPSSKLGFDDSMSLRSFGASARRSYQPSFDALIKGIRGKAPKSSAKLALGTRPISKRRWWEFGK